MFSEFINNIIESAYEPRLFYKEAMYKEVDELILFGAIKMVTDYDLCPYLFQKFPFFP
uniref:Uncharacterized protein n=1 Tax=Lepeophtheirus salmonis TaxID=72036 RepID=A0A0K2TEK3_LEPSM